VKPHVKGQRNAELHLSTRLLLREADRDIHAARSVRVVVWAGGGRVLVINSRYDVEKREEMYCEYGTIP
jgi:hypothetical protein